MVATAAAAALAALAETAVLAVLEAVLALALLIMSHHQRLQAQGVLAVLAMEVKLEAPAHRANTRQRLTWLFLGLLLQSYLATEVLKGLDLEEALATLVQVTDKMD